jgi:hypothetical protein
MAGFTTRVVEIAAPARAAPGFATASPRTAREYAARVRALRSAMRWLAVVLLVIAACGGGRPRTDRWFAERGARADTWYVCARIGASLRATCNGDRACETYVTEQITMPCYVARYRAPVGPGGGAPRPATLSPCFWARGDGPAPATSPPAYAQATCAAIAAEPALRPHCEAELRMLVEDVCRRGGPALTGAGP